MVRIDGSHGEGGGQILRTALALAAITGEELVVEHIRANRPKPGLRPQHLAGALAVAAITGGQVEGARVGSTELRLIPGSPRPGEYEFDIASGGPSAGSVTLLAQTLLPIAVASGGEWGFTLKGGTHVPFSPPYDYLERVFLPSVRPMGVRAELRLERAGYYPQGGGAIRLMVSPSDGLVPLRRIAPLSVEAVRTITTTSGLPEDAGDRAIAAARAALPGDLAARAEVVPLRPSSPARGFALMVLLDGPSGPAGFPSLGERAKRAEHVGHEAGEAAARFVAAGRPVDAHLADQLMLYMALAPGGSVLEVEEITQHARTNALVVETLLPKRFVLDGNRIECRD